MNTIREICDEVRETNKDLTLSWICCRCLIRGHNATLYQPWKKPICTADGCPWHLRCKHCSRTRCWTEKILHVEAKEELIVEGGEEILMFKEDIVVLDEVILIVDINEYVGWSPE